MQIALEVRKKVEDLAAGKGFSAWTVPKPPVCSPQSRAVCNSESECDRDSFCVSVSLTRFPAIYSIDLFFFSPPHCVQNEAAQKPATPPPPTPHPSPAPAPEPAPAVPVVPLFGSLSLFYCVWALRCTDCKYEPVSPSYRIHASPRASSSTSLPLDSSQKSVAQTPPQSEVNCRFLA